MRTTGAHWQRLEALFDAALDVPEAEQATWLAAACEDETLRTEVVRLLDAHRRAGGILDGPAPSAADPEELRARLSRALEDRYAIEEELGSGGMAVVFRAHERKHARPVVLKVLKPEVAAICGTQRFVREVRIAARLAHPHIVPLIDSGDADGLLYYVMSYVPGETLRARLARDGALPPVEALSLLRDVAQALGHAHRAGVVHRDLKPENVLCAGAHAYLLDFGIAKVTLRAGGMSGVLRSESLPTLDGSVLGTPAYMPPEQQIGGAVDARADVYAWGVLAHEMLAGELPQRGDRIGALGERADIPPALTAIVKRCLAPVAADRPADGDAVGALLDTLDTPAFGMSALAAAAPAPSTAATTRYEGAGAGAVARPAWRPRARGVWRWLATAGAIAALLGGRALIRALDDDAGARRGRVGLPVAVAALENETGEPALDPIGRMAGDWVTQGLQEAGAGAITVVPWPTSHGASERVRHERAAGRRVNEVALLREETGARTLVTGAYYLFGDSLRFHATLVLANPDTSHALTPVVVPRDSAQRAVRELRDRLMTAIAMLADERFSTVPELAARPPSFEAYQTFDRAMQRFVAQAYDVAAPEFRRAHEQDSTFLPALLYAATAYWNFGEFARADTMMRTLRPRRGALSAYHRGWADYLEASLAGDGPRALEAIRGAAALSPTSRAGYNLASLALETDRPREALDALERMNPDRGDMRGWSSYWTQLAHAHHLLGAHDRELAATRELRRRFPDRTVGVVLEARALAASGRSAALDSLLGAAARALPATTYWSAGAAMVAAGEELLAHGGPSRAAEGHARLESGIAWLEAERARTPGERGHRYWLARAFYNLERWPEAAAAFGALARDYPERLRYRGFAALAAAHAGSASAEGMLGTAAPHERGTMATYRALLVAARGDRATAAAQLTDAARFGVDDLTWMHDMARPDLAAFGRDVERLPVSLRVRP